MSFCRVTIFGNIGSDPKQSVTKSGTLVASLSVAYNPSFDKSIVCWLNCIAFSKNAEFCTRYLAKGNKVIIEGNLEIEKYEDNNGISRTVPKVIIREISSVYGKEDGNGNNGNQNGGGRSGGYNNHAGNNSNNANGNNNNPPTPDYSNPIEEGLVPF